MARLVLVLAIALMFMEYSAIGGPSCQTVISRLSPCISYLSKREAKPPNTCCDGVRYLSKFSNQKKDRQAMCECILQAVPSVGPIDFSLIPSLPNYCGASENLPPISSNLNCSRI
ncbi:Non-specific lipid-transfer protein [Quillaja saponaria]|uniref:Non-specific lipid-transfer protein n=1 Tax=Quillaja saponaria TaxID=32244 RepID=A0AAD7L6I7_QUISA|nr:Non-specific lipid-transfer protein [Quillaja saponaria]